jgi:hypothetical protein
MIPFYRSTLIDIAADLQKRSESERDPAQRARDAKRAAWEARNALELAPGEDIAAAREVIAAIHAALAMETP